MIRDVVVGRVRPDVPRRQVEEALAAIVAREPAGCLDLRVGVEAAHPGDFGFLPAGFSHGYQIVEDARMMGTLPAGSSGSSSTWAPRPITPPRSSRRSSRTSRACRRPRGSTHVARRPRRRGRARPYGRPSCGGT